MGNKTGGQVLLDDFSIVKQLTDSRYGEIKVYKVKEGKERQFPGVGLVCLKYKLTNNKQDAEKLFQEAISRQGIEIGTILELYKA